MFEVREIISAFDAYLKKDIQQLIRHKKDRDGNTNFLGNRLPTSDSFLNTYSKGIKKIVALEGKRVIGLCLVRLYKGETATLEMIKVSSRRQGVGTRMMHLVEDIVFAHESKTELRLSVEDRNTAAKNFYERMGWSVTNGVAEDLRRWEDLRPCAATYVSACRRRLLEHIPVDIIIGLAVSETTLISL